MLLVELIVAVELNETILRSYLAEVKTYYFMWGHIWKLGYSRLGSATTKNKIPRH